MHYDVLAESIRLLEGGPVSGTARLSRRIRHVALAVDRDGDVAATMFLRRGVSGEPMIDLHTLELLDGRWRLLGGSSGPGEATTARPRLADLGRPAVSQGGGGTARSRRGWFRPWRSTWVSYAELRVAQEGAVLRVDDRVVPVADHGYAVVVWAQGPPSIRALDASGAVLGTVTLSG